MRLAGSIMMDINEEYVTGRKYINMEENNNGKIGHPYKVPDALIMYLARLRFQRVCLYLYLMEI